MATLSNRLIFKKYRMKKLIYSSSFTSVYEGINTFTKQPVALKSEKIEG